MQRYAAALALLLVCVAFPGCGSARAQEDPPDCPAPTDLGILTDVLTATGSWSTYLCGQSQFLDNRPGQLLAFSLAEQAEVRIDLSSSGRDAIVYLQGEDGRLIDAADDTGSGVNARIERTPPVGAPVDQWLRTAPVAHEDEELGRIYARRLSNGVVQATYVPNGASMASTSRWVVPADAPVNAWLASGELERGPVSRDDLVQRVADQAAGPGAAQFGDHLSLLSLIENNLQRNP